MLDSCRPLLAAKRQPVAVVSELNVSAELLAAQVELQGAVAAFGPCRKQPDRGPIFADPISSVLSFELSNSLIKVSLPTSRRSSTAVEEMKDDCLIYLLIHSPSATKWQVSHWMDGQHTSLACCFPKQPMRTALSLSHGELLAG